MQHALGATEVPAEPQRVLTLHMSFVDAALILGVPIQGYTVISASQDGLPEYFGEARETYAAEAVPLGDLAQPEPGGHRRCPPGPDPHLQGPPRGPLRRAVPNRADGDERVRRRRLLAEQQLVSSGLWNGLRAVAAGRAHQVPDETWMSAVGMFGAQAILDDLAETFDVEVAR